MVVATRDKVVDIFVNRLDQKVSGQVADDPTGTEILHEDNILMDVPHKRSILSHFHVGDIVTRLHKVALVTGGREVVLYTRLYGYFVSCFQGGC